MSFMAICLFRPGCSFPHLMLTRKQSLCSGTHSCPLGCEIEFTSAACIIWFFWPLSTCSSCWCKPQRFSWGHCVLLLPNQLWVGMKSLHQCMLKPSLGWLLFLIKKYLFDRHRQHTHYTHTQIHKPHAFLAMAINNLPTSPESYSAYGNSLSETNKQQTKNTI